MATCATFQVRMASVMQVLTKTALAEITKLVDDASVELRLEMCRSQRENEALKSKLLVMEGELRAARGCGEGKPGSSLNIAFEVNVCDEFREAQNSKVGGEESVAVERVKDEHDDMYVGLPMWKKKTVPDALDIKYEPVDGEQHWSESVLLNEHWLEEDPKMSQPQLEQKFSEEDVCGTSGTAAANGGEGPLCEEEEEELHMQPCPAGDPEKGLLAELKQEPDGDPLTPGHPLFGSAEGLVVQCAWSKATRSEKVQEMPRHHGGGSEHRGVRSNDRFSPRHFRGSRRLCTEKNEGAMSHLEQQHNGHPRRLPNSISTDMAFPLRSRGERIGSASCEESFDVSAEAESRQRIKGLEEFVCMCCGKTFPDALELQMHEGQHSTGRRFSCSDCGKRFPDKSHLKMHQRVHTGEKPHSCDECGKSFAHLRNLKCHQMIHTGEKPHSCDKCGKSFAHLYKLKSHQMVHTGEKPHSCEECGKSFAHLRNLKSHQMVHSGEKPHSCEECGKSFAHLRNLKTHQRVHTGEKPHSCDECGKSFVYLHVLKHHQRVHTGEKPHSCDECGKSFAQLSNLNYHQIVHMEEKPHSCNECGKSFAQLCHLKSHQIVHTGEKLHSCNECGKSFSHLCTLKTHQRVHTGEKPHSCDECGKSFAHLCNLKTHQRVHTGEKPYICTLCSKSFSQNRYLQKHILTHSL